MATGDPLVRSLAETQAVLAEPFALEDLANQPTPLLATHLAPGDHLGEDALTDLTHMLGSVRAVTVAVIDEAPTRALADIASGFDVIFGPPGSGLDGGVVEVEDIHTALGTFAAAVEINPHSAVTLAELLRQRAWDRVPQGLVLESLAYSTLQSGPAFAAWLAQRGPAEIPVDPEPPVLVERGPTSLHVTLNRPHRSNAFTADVRDALVETLRLAAADPLLDGIVLDGAGASFSSGGDLAEFGSTPDPATGHMARVQRSPAWWVDRLSSNVRVHLHGHCVGAGIEVPAFAGTVLAASDTRIRLPEVAMGLIPGAGGTVSIPRRIGPHRTAWLAITGAELSASEALAWGLVDRVVE